MAISSALSTAGSLAAIPCGRNDGGEAAARRELSDYGGAHRLGRFDHVAQHAVDGVFLKDAEIAIRKQVHLVGFQLQAPLVRHIPQNDAAEIRQARFRTYRSKLRHHDFDFVIGILVGPGFDFGELRIHARRGVFICVAALHERAFESRSRNKPTSVTTPTACPVPRSLTLVATAGLISTHTILTQLGSMFPVAIECSMVPRQSTRPAPWSCSA